MEKLTKSEVSRAHKREPKRRCFATHPGLGTENAAGDVSFSVNFPDTIQPIFEAQTGLHLDYIKKYKNYRLTTNSAAPAFTEIENWIKNQGTRVFLRDCLSLSLALDFNLESNRAPTRTHFGALEHDAKNNQAQGAIDELATATAHTITALPFYKDADFMCAVPSAPEKAFDLPRDIATLTSARIGKRDITAGFAMGAKTQSVKQATLDEKWDIWEDTGLHYNGFDISGKDIILIDDKYQSGATLQFAAMKLQEAGASRVYGLSMVKTLRDTDNK